MSANTLPETFRPNHSTLEVTSRKRQSHMTVIASNPLANGYWLSDVQVTLLVAALKEIGFQHGLTVSSYGKTRFMLFGANIPTDPTVIADMFADLSDRVSNLFLLEDRAGGTTLQFVLNPENIRVV